MHVGSSVQKKIRTGKKANIWLALFAALCIHVVIIILPFESTLSVTDSNQAHIEVQLTAFSKPHKPLEVEVKPEPPPSDIKSIPEPSPESFPVPVKPLVTETPVEQPIEPIPRLQTTAPPARDLVGNLDTMSETARSRLTNAILARQYISEEPLADKLFGRSFRPEPGEYQREFHYPARQSMIAMLDKPLPDVPFAYTPGLIHFTYDPGVKGDLQRFWDVITPEWGFRTRYGTEVRCAWILIFAGCAWK